jgi:putative tricarboxylic transport membrane protein
MHAIILLVALALVATGTPSHAQSGWKPVRNIEIIVGGTGTGPDRLARIIDRAWRENKVLDVPTAVVNKPGGGGAVSWAYLSQQAGDPHYLLITSYSLVTGHINGLSKVTYRDFTMLTLLASEYVAYSVVPDSPVKSIKELVGILRNDPGAFPIAVSSALGGANHIALLRLMKAGGVDTTKLKVVVFRSSSDALTALLGGHVGLFVNSASASSGALINGQIRAIGLAAPKRFEGAFAHVPTLSESGFPVIAENWRLVIAPKGIGDEQASFWEKQLLTLTKTKEWDAELRKSFIPNEPRSRAETQRYVAEQYEQIKSLLVEVGLAK